MRRFAHVPLILLLVTLSGCESAQIAKSVAMHMYDRDAEGHYKVGQPYRVGGKWYYPKEDPAYSETGTASWYGREFQGRATANGETFDRHIASAAHRTLPLPSMVRVTNIDNGKSMLVRVNDRGPYARNRIIDVSEKVAKELGFREKGTAHVRVTFDQQATASMFTREDHKHFARAGSTKNNGKTEVATVQLASTGKTIAVRPPRSALAPARRSRAASSPDLYIQTGSFSSHKNAKNVAQTLGRLAKVRIQEVAFPERTLYRVRLGPLSDEHDADALLNKIGGMGFNDAIIVQD